MPPFAALPVIEGFKERIESLGYNGDKLYLGTSVGSLHIYTIEDAGNGHAPTVALSQVKTRFTRRSVEQLGFIKDLSSLVVLTERSVSLYPLSTLAGPTLLAQTKGSALVFAVDAGVQHIAPTTILGAIEHPGAETNISQGVPTVVTTLVVGCTKRVVVFTWKDGEAQPVKELTLPHTPRAIVFPDPNSVFISCSVSDHLVLSIPNMTVTEIALPTTSNISAVPGMGALSGLGGYMTLGMGSKMKLNLVRIGEGEVAVGKDNGLLFYGLDGKPSRDAVVEWPTTPDDVAFIHPYIISILPPGAVSASSTSVGNHVMPSQSLQMRSSSTLKPVQTLHLPAKLGAPAVGQSLRLMNVPTGSKPPLFLVSTTTDKAAITTLWSLSMQPWTEQLDELLNSHAYSDALALLSSIPRTAMADKDDRERQAKTLRAVQLFSEAKFNEAMDTFIALDTNPALVIGLYPEDVSGRLSVPKRGWIEVFGGRGSLVQPEEVEDLKEKPEKESDMALVTGTTTDDSKLGMTGKLMAGLEGLLPSGSKDDDLASTNGKGRTKPDDYHRSLETLLRYLPDRRQKVLGAFSAQQEPKQTPTTSLSDIPVPSLQSLPSVPCTQLTPEQLLQIAQVVDTALFKSYLVVRPALIGSLCRLDPNWCEVSEVETELKARKKYAELIDLYRGKKMHDKALQLLHELSSGEEDEELALGPTIRYLQRLGVQHLDVIFRSADWVFAASPTLALEIFTADLDEVDSLPRPEVASYLQRIDPTHNACIRYLEHLMTLGEESRDLNERLAELYLEKSEKGGHDGEEAYRNLLRFMEDTDRYTPDRLLSRLPMEGLFEARAILLGRLGRHEGALQIYVNKLNDYAKAEQYCKRMQAEKPNIFLSLLQLYLAPGPNQPLLLGPALSLIAHHSVQLDPMATLSLLPPLVSARDVSRFMARTLHDERRWSKVEKEVRKARGESVAYELVTLQERRVKVTDSRICPQCRKRFGATSAIAVHAPRGEVTHYHCREAFSQKMPKYDSHSALAGI